MLAYENRVVAFVDILGFGALVEASSGQPELVERISKALDAVNPQILFGQMFGKLNRDKIPQADLAKVEHEFELFKGALVRMHEVRISYFSDSIVLSASADDVVASQIVVDLIGRLQTTMWMDHRLLVRGGIAKGELVHVQGGQLFGPAMNCAYHLESKLADGPRVLIHPDCLAHFEVQSTWGALAPFFELDQDGRSGISLASSYLQLLEHSAFYLGGDQGWWRLHSSLMLAPSDLMKIRAQQTVPRVISKYDWLIPKIEAVKARMSEEKLLLATRGIARNPYSEN